ncbi:Uroporphyrinogen-III synthase [Vibrio stylophorae]|uniref:Uroporphyrinogen-III synthase n=1 Tax=Vibrio stylophorae TaxID=659351 RepID=A0ABM8ZWL8_9VIBR|nr:uroporphyrinogen-III synthase [Vibrio stylophorae]CAH0534737.1 Uroporphyrinogen-III synthase [Vibrio stylophorae]
MSILITRPEPNASAICQALAQFNIDAIAAPLLQLSPCENLHQLSQAIQHSDILIAVSEHAVHSVDLSLQRLQVHWPSQIQYFAIGDKSQKTLHNCCQRPVLCPTVGVTSEALLERKELKNIAGKQILIIRGPSGRDLLYEQLSARGATVQYYQAYQRHYLPISSQQWQHWQSIISHLVITSGDMLNYLYQQCPKSAQNWLTDRTLWVPSERISEIAKAIGFNRIQVVSRADNATLIAALRQAKQDGTL